MVRLRRRRPVGLVVVIVGILISVAALVLLELTSRAAVEGYGPNIGAGLLFFGGVLMIVLGAVIMLVRGIARHGECGSR